MGSALSLKNNRLKLFYRNFAQLFPVLELSKKECVQYFKSLLVMEKVLNLRSKKKVWGLLIAIYKRYEMLGDIFTMLSINP